MSEQKLLQRKTSYEDYDIDLTHPELCPRCSNATLKINREKETWHCENTQECNWSGRLRLNEKALIMNAADAAPQLERWMVAGSPQGMSWGHESLDGNIKAVRGEWTLVVGHTSHGKSHLIDEFIVRGGMKGWKYGLFSPENTPYERHVKGMAQKFIGKRFSSFDRDDLRLAKKWLSERVFFVQPVEPTFEAVLAQFRKLVKMEKIQCAIIDPWNEVEHAVPRGMTETQYVARKLIQFRRFCEAMHVHGIIVAHPGKLSADRKFAGSGDKLPIVRLTDVSGSAHFANKCDFGVSVWRNTMSEKLDDQGHDERHVNHVYILKARNEDQGRVGKVKLVWDPKSTSYYSYDQPAPGEPPADSIKSRLDRTYGGGKEGAWRHFLMTPEERKEEKLKQRPGVWQKTDNEGELSFSSSDLVANVREIIGPKKEVSYYCCVSRVKFARGKVIESIDLLEEEEFTVKDDALDWCEKKLMQPEEPKQ